MNRQTLFTIVFFALLAVTSTKIFEKCELARALLRNGFAKDQLPDWVCLVYSESSGNTGARAGPNRDKSYNYGLFQINSACWCDEKSPGGSCRVKCSKLLNANIADDSKCAQLIYGQYGFDAWYGWKSKCNGTLPNLSYCGI